MDQPCWCRTWSSIQTSPGCMGSLLCQCGRRAPTLAQATPASDHAARAPVLPRRLCTFGDRLSALFVIPYTEDRAYLIRESFDEGVAANPNNVPNGFCLGGCPYGFTFNRLAACA